MKLLTLVIIGLLGLTSSVSHQDLAQEASVLARPVVIGASVSAGFSAGRDFSQVLDVMIDREHQPIEKAFSALFWMDSVKTGESQVAFALGKKPTLLIAIDFLFWFGYGSMNLEGEPITSEEERLELLEYGLGLLEPFSCSVVLGDFPDCEESVGIILKAGQVPGPKTLSELNKKLRSWAKGRDNIVVLPLSDKFESIRNNEKLEIGAHVCEEGTTEELLLPDRIHLTLEGLVWLSYLLVSEVAKEGWIEDSDVNADLEAVFQELKKDRLR
jgi:hypothetical protein